MGEAERQDGPAVTPPDDSGAVPATPEPDDRGPEQIEHDIEQTREELADTVAALAEKTDVKSRAKDKVQDVKQTVVGKKDEVVGKAQAKKDEFASKAQGASPSSIDTDRVAATAKDTAQKPPAIAGAAFVSGFLLGIIIGKRRAR
jgi:uncharacterized protein DUF3618